MIFKQFYLETLGHASYFIGSEATGEALVLDARRDVDIYFREARVQGMRIRYAADTHQHNDYLTGICELPARGDVRLLAGARAELGYQARRMSDGERLKMGEIEFEILHTPGHTPEHISVLVYDNSRGEEPALLLPGGALLAGDVGRPDLLGGKEETEEQARELCRTLQEKILPLPDSVEVFPTHVAGSLCGGSISSRLSTTIGYERKMNALLRRLSSQDEFVKHCLELKLLPGIPPYWKRMRKINQAGPSLLGVLREPPALPVHDFDQLRIEGAVILDCRSPEAFAWHIPGAINVYLGTSFAIWAGTVLTADTPYALVLDEEQDLWDACWQLLRIGYELPAGWLAGGMRAWRMAGQDLQPLPQWTVRQLQEGLARQDDLVVLDVRQPREWAAGHIEEAVHITGAELPGRIDEVPTDKEVAVICGSGYRSSVIASFLQSKGHRCPVNILGGMQGWTGAGFKKVK